MARRQMTDSMLERIDRVLAYLKKNPWKTRAEISDAMGFDIDEFRRVYKYLDLQSRPRFPGRKRPVEYACLEVPPNPFK